MSPCLTPLLTANHFERKLFILIHDIVFKMMIFNSEWGICALNGAKNEH